MCGYHEERDPRQRGRILFPAFIDLSPCFDLPLSTS
jgi:hypothetical protein